MKITIELKLPYPPSVNTYWRRSGHRIHISARGLRYRHDVIKSVTTGERFCPFNESQRISVKILLNPPDHRIRDIDNVLKALFDSLTHAGVYPDDSQIDEITIKRGETVKCGLVTIELSELK